MERGRRRTLVTNMPGAEVHIDTPLVRQLLRRQFPEAAEEPLQVVANGWDNVIFRLGSALTVRLPRRILAVPLVEHEHRWLAELAPRLPLPVPAPVYRGRPDAGYPWPWSVGPWFEGNMAAVDPPTDTELAARTIGTFLAALHQPAAPDAPPNPYRGVPLGDRAAPFEDRLTILNGMIDVAAVRQRWADALAAEVWAGPALWLHGDLHPANLIVSRGQLSAVIDFGDLTAGDPATDLAVAWMLLPPRHHDVLRAAYGGVDDATWTRARGWALNLAVAMLAHSADNPVLADVGRQTVHAVCN